MFLGVTLHSSQNVLARRTLRFTDKKIAILKKELKLKKKNPE
jgi:hypothetical protein